MINPDKQHSYIITWHVNIIKFGAHGRNHISLGICEHTQRTAFIAIFNPDNAATQEAIKPLIVKNVFTNTNKCEDGEHCLDLKCPLNYTTAKTFKGYGVNTEKKLQNLTKHIEDFHSEISLHESLNTREEGVAVYYEKPLLTVKRQKPRKTP